MLASPGKRPPKEWGPEQRWTKAQLAAWNDFNAWQGGDSQAGNRLIDRAEGLPLREPDRRHCLMANRMQIIVDLQEMAEAAADSVAKEASDRNKAQKDSIQKFLDILRSMNPQSERARDSLAEAARQDEKIVQNAQDDQGSSSRGRPLQPPRGRGAHRDAPLRAFLPADRPDRTRRRSRLRHPDAQARARAASPVRQVRRTVQVHAILRRGCRRAEARPAGRHRRPVHGLSRRAPRRAPRRRLLRPGNAERLHDLSPRRWPCREDAHGPVGGPGFSGLARQPLQRAEEDPCRSGFQRADTDCPRSEDPSD